MVNKPIVRRQREVIELLLKEGLITQDQLKRAREETRRTGLTIEQALEKLGFIMYEDVVKVQATALGLPYMDLTDYIVDTELVKLIPENIARKYHVVPLFKIANSITIGMVDPQDIEALDQVRRVTQMDMVEPVLVSDAGVQRILDTYYGGTGSIEDIVQSIDTDELSRAEGGSGLTDVADDAPIVKLVNSLILQAVKERASDIHVEPEEDSVRVRNRVDGILREITVVPKKLQEAIISRIKVLAKCDIAETRKPQDGRIRMKMEDTDVDLRVSTFPTVNGENVVMRILDRSSVILGLREVGFLDSDLEKFEKLIRRPYGIVLVTGPTGSGKTSTLYTALTAISSIEKNIVTIEDPVEYELPLIRQTQVNPKAGIAFANGLRGILRQDPDIIMVGEIRDKETAEIAIQAALTGHLVLSTLHTNDAPSTLTRLTDMGIEPFLISSSVCGIIAQRLVRVICEKCKETYHPNPDVLSELGIHGKGEEFYFGKGCSKCNGTGFAGRCGIFEILVITEEIRQMIDKKISADEIRKKAQALGMTSLRQDGLSKIRQGLTTPEEVVRVTEVEG